MQKGSREYHRSLSEDEKIKKRNYANKRNKDMTNVDQEKRKEYMKNHYNRK